MALRWRGLRCHLVYHRAKRVTGWDGGWIGSPNNVVAGSLVMNGVATAGNRFTTDANSYLNRIIGTAGHAALVTNGKFGKDGTTLWLSFLMRVETITPNNYAGLNLYGGDVQQLYIGVPTGQSSLSLSLCPTQQLQASFVGLGAWQTILVRFGPVLLPLRPR